jgi:drug/metabolite transporter (DMT)-like permease
LARAEVASVPSPPVSAAGRRILPWIALIAVYILWGSTYPAIRVAVETIPPLLSAGVRYVIAGAILLPIALRLGDREGDPIGRAQWVAAGIYGLALMGGGNGGVSWGEQTVPAGTAALIVASVPLWMTLADRLVNRARIGVVGVVGLLVGFAGVALLVSPSSGAADPVGMLVIVIASMSWAGGSIYARGAPMPRRALVGTGIAMLVGGAGLLLAGVAIGELGDLRLDGISSGSLLALLWLIGPGSILGFSAYTFALSTLPTSTVATYAYVNPVVAVLLGLVLLNEALTGWSLVAGALILVAVAMLLTTRSRRPAGRVEQARAAQPDQPGVTSPDS